MSTALADLDLQALLATEPYVRLLSRHAAESPEAAALTVGETTLTRRELDRSSNRWARAFAERGVSEGDFVTIALPNSVEFFLATIAAWKVGAVPQPVSPVLPLAERQQIVDLAAPALVLGVEPEDHPERVCLPATWAPPPSVDDGPLPEVISPAAKAPTSGGSTGRPKLIVSGTPAVVAPAAVTFVFGMLPTDRQLVCGPTYHNAPFQSATSGLLLGQHVVVLPRFDARRALEAIDRHQVSWLLVVPTMLGRMSQALDDEPDAFSLSSVRQLWHAAAPCPPRLKEAWIERLGPERVLEFYGGTEGSAMTRISGTEWLEHRGSVGRPFVGEMRVLDDAGQPLPPGEVGEIYMRRPQGTPETYRYVGAEAKQRDGWETLGDLGWMDEDGYLYLSDRRTDMIVSGGANVYPAEVESALDEHPLVLSSVVVGLPDADLGQRVHAVVQAAAPLTDDELRAHLAERLVRYKVPRSFELTEEALRDDAGKVRRAAVRDAAVARLAAAEPRTP